MALEYNLVAHHGHPHELPLEGRPADVTGCILLQKVDGLDSPTVTEHVEQRYGGGDILAGVHVGGRTLTLEGLIVADTHERLRALEGRLRRAFQPTVGTWPILLVGRAGDPGPLTMDVRVTQPLQTADEGSSNRQLIKDFTVGLRSPTPWLMGAAWHTVTVTPPESSDGLTFPMVFPLQFFGQPTTGVPVVNGGDATAWPRLRIHGRTVNPRVTNLTTGETFALQGTVNTGEWVDVDPQSRTVTTTTSASAYSLVNRSVTSWWGLAPGVNAVAMLDQDHDQYARVDVTWRDTHL